LFLLVSQNGEKTGNEKFFCILSLTWNYISMEDVIGYKQTDQYSAAPWYK
jgi:hypothetical protein